MSLSAGKQPAITKHPNGTASFCIRVGCPSGGTLEIVAEKPLPLDEIAKSLEEYAAHLRRIASRDEAHAGSTQLVQNDQSRDRET